ncbi:MAG: hypothetical protein ACXV3D_09925 [Halobacteriota archaeon]
MGYHIGYTGTLKGGRCLNWVNHVILALRRSIPVQPGERTFSEAVGGRYETARGSCVFLALSRLFDVNRMIPHPVEPVCVAIPG